MDLREIIEKLDLELLTAPQDYSAVHPTFGYTSDLLSCVMAAAKPHSIWVTLQAHVNIVAVAALLELSAVIITENARPDLATVARANEEGITLLSTKMDSYTTVGRLWELGLAGA